MSATGFKVFNTNKDLSEIFAPRTSAARANTGYKTLSTRKDISETFELYVSGTKAPNTGFKLADNVTDLCDVFAPLPPKPFELANIGEISPGTSFSGFIWGITSANNGIGYFTGYQNITGTPAVLFKTTNKGVNFSSLTVPNGGIRGVATNQSNNMLTIMYSGTVRIQYSNDGGALFNSSTLSTDVYSSCIMARNLPNNPTITNTSNQNYCTYLTSNYTTRVPYSNLPTPPTATRPSSLSGANSISNVPNLFVCTEAGLNVFRNQTNGILTNAGTGTNTAVSITYADGALVAKYVCTCCNADNTVNLIVNRTTSTTTGGRIYKSTAWDGLFTEVIDGPIDLWNGISTSSAGNVVCAISDTSIYISKDRGNTWTKVVINATLLTSEKFLRVSVSPDEKFIIVATNNPALTNRIFYCSL
jgi:hypothetical protein